MRVLRFLPFLIQKKMGKLRSSLKDDCFVNLDRYDS
jgi:hypothetical protein